MMHVKNLINPARNNLTDLPISWQKRVGKSSSAAESIYHAVSGIDCITRQKPFFCLAAWASFVTTITTVFISQNYICVSLAVLTSGIAIGYAMILDVFTRLQNLDGKEVDQNNKKV